MNPEEPASIPRVRSRADEWRAFLGRRLSSSFERRVVSIQPGSARDVDPDAWRDAIVIVRRGELELDCAYAGRASFAPGAVIWLSGRNARWLRNRGEEPVVLVAIRRRV
jgi:hypothetical protein